MKPLQSLLFVLMGYQPMDKEWALRVLIDRSVRHRAVRGEQGFVEKTAVLDGNRYSYLSVSTSIVPARKDWLQREIECLPRIALLVAQGKVSPCSTSELDAEESRILKFPANPTIDLFSDFEFERLSPPLERSKWSISRDEYVSKEHVISYCERYLLTLSEERIEALIHSMQDNPGVRLTEFEMKSLRNTSRFKEICRGIHRNHYPDALHLWTAEENSVERFLTLDKTFRNVMEKQDVDLRCKIVFPSELAFEVEKI